MTTKDEMLKIIENFSTAWVKQDIDALMELMSDDCIYKASVGPEPGTTYSGRDDVRKGFTELTALESGGEQRSGQIWFSGDYAFTEWSYDEIDDSGKVIDIQGIDIFHFVNGKIKLKDAYRKAKK